MRVSRFVKSLFKIGATTVAAGLKGGLAGPVGAVVGGVLADKLGIDVNDPNFEKRVIKAAQTAEGRQRIMLAELEIKSSKIKLFSELELAELNASVRTFEQAQQSYRTELQTGDKYISRTRPMIIRRLFVLVVVMVLALIGAVVFDSLTDSLLMAECFKDDIKKNKEVFTSCLEFIDERDSYATRLTTAYADNWQWLSLLFSIFGLYYGGRTYERRFNVQAKD